MLCVLKKPLLDQIYALSPPKVTLFVPLDAVKGRSWKDVYAKPQGVNNKMTSLSHSLRKFCLGHYRQCRNLRHLTDDFLGSILGAKFRKHLPDIQAEDSPLLTNQVN